MASSNQQVVQAIFDSLTRCFHPINEESPISNHCPRQSQAEPPTTTTGAFEGDKKSSGSSSGGSSSDASRRPSSDNLKTAQSDRYIHRKLEIFRTNDEDLAELGVEHRPASKQAGSSSQPRSRHRRDRSVSKTNTLVESSSNDEIANLTKSQKRTAQDDGDDGQDDSPMATFARLLRDPFSCLTEVKKPLGLCFATPIRTSSVEDISNMSDWKLTAGEFAARQERHLCKSRCTADVPDGDESSASLSHPDDEETITSASYFEQKYSHLVETNPPMPLFGYQRVAVSEFETDELFRLVKRREGGAGGSSPPRNRSNPRRRPSPTDHIIVKKQSATNRKSSSRSGRPTSRRTSSQNKNQHYDSAIPIGRSSSVSSAPSAEVEEPIRNAPYRRSRDSDYQSRMRLREPDIVYSTAAGI